MVSAVKVTSLKKPVAEDDFESQQKRNVRQPEMCVDYLSYNFDEMDLAASWRVMTKQKKDVVDGIRLENASWRTWAKQRNNLKTISPQTLNWLKDSDVTWLYGPLHTVIRTEEDPFLTPRKATTEETLGLMVPHVEKTQLKSALKKVTTADLLKRSASELLDISPPEQHHPQPRKLSIAEVNNEYQAVSPAVLATHRQPRLRFNHQVEQCIALTDEEREHGDITEEGDSMDDDDMDDDIDDSDDDTDQIHTSYNDRPRSIKKIAPARLKKSQSDVDTDDVCSISSTSTASSVGFITRSPVVSSPAPGLSEDTDEEEVLSFYDRPTVSQQPSIRPAVPTRTSSSSITQPYKEKTNIAEPALVTMHQTATDIHKDNGGSTSTPTLLNNLANWAASYLWPNENNKSNHKQRPSPQPSLSASIIPTVAIPIERHYAPTSSNSSSL
ncbi:hypothetical protein INT47_009946 [Mucor saturninus]|uniref:Nitrogen regulatory protein areA GATA-like domain-containing protein n=1 Tax=Mucor saturninus TaxID=64648 RepID=A0A8H7UZ50_9FUNG|nr:hypothetical protein INT47_009946 [Mucor saturninus]